MSLAIISDGGWVMVPLLGCSVIALAIILERYIALSRNKVLPPKLVERLRHDLTDTNTLLNGSALGYVLKAGLESKSRGPAFMQKAMDEASEIAVTRLERFITTLGIIATISPLLGLLGTILGMMQMFSGITEFGQQMPLIASGIQQALITTAAGLVIAIVSVVAHRVFERKIDNYYDEFRTEGKKLLQLIA